MDGFDKILNNVIFRQVFPAALGMYFGKRAGGKQGAYLGILAGGAIGYIWNKKSPATSTVGELGIFI